MLNNLEILFLFLTFLPAVLGDCPPAEDIHPCSCRESFYGAELQCWNMNTPEDLVYPIGATVGHRMFSILVKNSSFMYVPHAVFNNTTYKKIFLVNTAVLALTDTDDAFQGLESTLEDFRATDAHYSAQWHWEHLRNLKSLQLVDVNYVELDALQADIPPLPKLEAIGIIKAGITYISDTVFANLPSLKIWDMRDNEITELKRSMLPRPANHLSVINLGNNKLKNLPVDFFEEMPSVTFLNLRDNQFVTLSEKVFENVFWEVTEIYFEGNPFRCDCRMSWLFGLKSTYHFKAECQLPESYKGRKIMDLTSKELNCPRGVEKILENQD